MHIVINTKNSHIWASIDNHIPLLCHQRYCDNFKLAMNPANICWSWRRLQHVFSVTILRLPRRPGDVLKMSWRCLEDVFAWCLEDILKMSWRRLEDVWPRPIYWSWLRRLEDVFWRHEAKANIFVLMKTSWRRLLKTNVCWDCFLHLIYQCRK